jgi:hypothetical protein
VCVGLLVPVFPTRGLLVVEVAGTATLVLYNIVDWWSDVNKSPLWQDRIFIRTCTPCIMDMNTVIIAGFDF